MKITKLLAYKQVKWPAGLRRHTARHYKNQNLSAVVPCAQLSHRRPTLLARQEQSPVFWSHDKSSGWLTLPPLVPEGSQLQGSQPSVLFILSPNVFPLHWLQLVPTTFFLHKHFPVFLSHTAELLTVPANSHIHDWHPNEADIPNPKLPSLHSSQASPCTFSLHTHCPVVLSHTVPWTVPRELQLHFTQPWSKFWKLSIHSSHRRPVTRSLHWHWPDTGSQNWEVDPWGLHSQGEHPSGLSDVRLK